MRPEQLPAGGPELRKLINGATPAAAGVSMARWRSVQSLVRRALRDLGVEVTMGADATPMTEQWAALVALLDDRQKMAVSRVVRYASKHGIEPGAFTLETFKAFAASVEQGVVSGDPAAILRLTARHFNAAAAANPPWPQICLPVSPNARRFSLAWSAFAPAFVRDVETFLADGGVEDVWSEHSRRALRPATIESRRNLIRIMASAMVLSGKVEIKDLTSLSDLVQIANVQAALIFMTARTGAATPYHLAYLNLAGTIARYYVKDEPLAVRLRSMHFHGKGKIDGAKAKGMKPKNRKRLRQFDNPKSVDALRELSLRVLQRAEAKKPPTHRDATHVMYGLMVAILLAAPMRRGNLTELKIGSSFIDYGKGRQRKVRVDLCGREVKNQIDYGAPLPERIHSLVEAWLTRYRPMICPVASDYLFPTATGGMRSRIALSERLKKFIGRETGLVMNAHLFRHLNAKLYLEFDPNGIETVRQLLGHSSSKTTLNAYAEFQTDSAFQRVDLAQAERPLKVLHDRRRLNGKPSRRPGKGR
jgi:integrase